ncbi:MAG: hypothetical protein PHN56_00575 [Candidatus Nanoarchaeia archaeon]|nr:hypothetical protein [Candidatus Nanoarchaeia archaeon]
MGLFDSNKKSSNISFPQNNEDMKPAFPEPPESIDDFDDLGSVKNSVESSMPENNEEGTFENALEEEMVSKEPVMPASFGQRPKMENVNPILYIKLSEYKEVVEATNKMRKDIERAKAIVGDLRVIEKDENSKLEKSEEVIKEVEDIISLFEKVMITPIE